MSLDTQLPIFLNAIRLVIKSKKALDCISDEANLNALWAEICPQMIDVETMVFITVKLKQTAIAFNNGEEEKGIDTLHEIEKKLTESLPILLSGNAITELIEEDCENETDESLIPLLGKLDDFAGSLVAATDYPPDDYPTWSYLTYETHMSELKELWTEIRQTLKRDMREVEFIDNKLQEAFTAFNAKEKDKGRKAIWDIYNLEIRKLR